MSILDWLFGPPKSDVQKRFESRKPIPMCVAWIDRSGKVHDKQCGLPQDAAFCAEFNLLRTGRKAFFAQEGGFAHELANQKRQIKKQGYDKLVRTDLEIARDGAPCGRSSGLRGLGRPCDEKEARVEAFRTLLYSVPPPGREDAWDAERARLKARVEEAEDDCWKILDQEVRASRKKRR